MPAVARIELQSPSAELGSRLRVLCALPRAGSLGRVGAMVARYGNDNAEVILEQNPRTCRALLDGGGCDVAVVADDPLGQHILDDRGQGDVPIIVVARQPSHASQRLAIRDDLVERGAFVWLVMTPKAAEFTVVFGLPKRTRLNALKNSARNCIRTRSVIGTCLKNDRSQLRVP